MMSDSSTNSPTIDDSSTTLSDEELKEFRKAILRYTASKRIPREDGEDIVSEVFKRFLKNPPPADHSRLAWTLQITHNVMMEWMRNRQRDKKDVSFEIAGERGTTLSTRSSGEALDSEVLKAFDDCFRTCWQKTKFTKRKHALD